MDKKTKVVEVYVDPTAGMDSAAMLAYVEELQVHAAELKAEEDAAAVEDAKRDHARTKRQAGGRILDAEGSTRRHAARAQNAVQDWLSAIKLELERRMDFYNAWGEDFKMSRPELALPEMLEVLNADGVLSIEDIITMAARAMDLAATEAQLRKEGIDLKSAVATASQNADWQTGRIREQNREISALNDTVEKLEKKLVDAAEANESLAVLNQVFRDQRKSLVAAMSKLRGGPEAYAAWDAQNNTRHMIDQVSATRRAKEEAEATDWVRSGDFLK